MKSGGETLGDDWHALTPVKGWKKHEKHLKKGFVKRWVRRARKYWRQALRTQDE